MRGISRGGMKVEPFMRLLASRLTGNARAVWSDLDRVWYLGSGYWRAVAGEEREDLEFGRTYLINPSYEPWEIEIVEQAMGLLLNHWESSYEIEVSKKLGGAAWSSVRRRR